MERASGFCVGVVAGEVSGDKLGADLMADLKKIRPDVRFVGVGGPAMLQQGLEPWCDYEALSVMGLFEVLKHLPKLLSIRRKLAKRFLEMKPDVFVGIDAPDFNLGLERRLKRGGIPTAHYVSPSIWAWREGRAKKIHAAADRVLCLFPMELPIYEKYSVEARYVGHPLAAQFPMVPDASKARQELGLAEGGVLIALLPGSRVGEIGKLGAIFAAAAIRLRRVIPEIRFIAPMANDRCKRAFQALLNGPLPEGIDRSDSPVTEEEWSRFSSALTLVDGRSHQAMIAADLLLMASGTAALEGMLAKRPMVVAYRVAAATYVIVKGLGMLKIDRYSLPNILAGEALVPELMQSECTPEKITEAMQSWLNDQERTAKTITKFEQLHRGLMAQPGAAASAVLELYTRAS
jgi:lipid-A-disaccharide synthase